MTDKKLKADELITGFTFFVLSSNGRSLSRYKIISEIELNLGNFLVVHHAVIAGDKFEQTMIAKDFVLGKKGSLRVFKKRPTAMKEFKKIWNW
jgi:hypothetical protein